MIDRLEHDELYLSVSNIAEYSVVFVRVELAQVHVPVMVARLNKQ